MNRPGEFDDLESEECPEKAIHIAEKDFTPAEIGDYGFLSGRFYHYENSIKAEYQGDVQVFVPVGDGFYRMHRGEDGLSAEVFAFADGYLQFVRCDEDLEIVETGEEKLSRVLIRIFDEKGELKPVADWAVKA